MKIILLILTFSLLLFANNSITDIKLDTTEWLQIFSGIAMVMFLHAVAYVRLIKKKPEPTTDEEK